MLGHLLFKDWLFDQREGEGNVRSSRDNNWWNFRKSSQEFSKSLLTRICKIFDKIKKFFDSIWIIR